MMRIEPTVAGYQHSVEIDLSPHGNIVRLHVDGPADLTEHAVLDPDHADRVAIALVQVTPGRAYPPRPQIVYTSSYPNGPNPPYGPRLIRLEFPHDDRDLTADEAERYALCLLRKAYVARHGHPPRSKRSP